MPNPILAHISTDLLTWEETVVDGGFETPTGALVRVQGNPAYPALGTSALPRVIGEAHTGSWCCRLKAGANQAELAKKIGIRQNMVSDFEHGRRRIVRTMARRVGEALGVDLVKRIEA